MFIGSVVLALPVHTHAQSLTRADSALVGNILLAEDRRDSSASVFATGMAHRDERIRTIARRGLARVRDARFAARDSLPSVAAPPAYPDPAWRLRFRALANARGNCPALRLALADTSWLVRLRAAALAGPECATDAGLIAMLRSWVERSAASRARGREPVSWHPAAHAIVALARVAPGEARGLLPQVAASRVPWLRVYAARAAGTLADTALLRLLAGDPDDNVKEAAIEALARVAGHAADDVYLTALGARGYQVIRVAARALRGSPRGAEVATAALAAAERLRGDSSETSRDARLALLERIGESATVDHAMRVGTLAVDFDCRVADSALTVALRLPPATGRRCSPLPIVLPPDAVALALGRDVRLRVTMADSTGGGSFVVRLRGDVAPVMAARVLALARAGWYDGLTWHRAEHDFVLQGGGPGANEYIGHPRFMRDELGTIAHQRGTVGMSTRGHDTGDAQWFINLRDNPRLLRDYTVFAEVVEGIDVVDAIVEGDVIARMTPVTP